MTTPPCWIAFGLAFLPPKPMPNGDELSSQDVVIHVVIEDQAGGLDIASGHDNERRMLWDYSERDARRAGG
jgi:hypothetical protein